MSGGRGVPQFPGKPGVTGTEAYAWEKQMCIPLTVGELTAIQTTNAQMTAGAAEARLRGSSGAPAAAPKLQPVEARRCQGPACAWFVPIGKTGDGGCAEKMKVTVMHTQTLLLEAIALKMGAIERDVTTQAAPTTPS